MFDNIESVFGSYQIVTELNALQDRLERNDPSLTVFEPWKESSLLFSMEEPALKDALYSCLDASSRATNIQRVLLRNLPEPELAYAMRQLAHNPHITQMHISDDTKSHSLQAQAIVDFLGHHQQRQQRERSVGGRGLQKLHISTRIVVSTTSHVEGLAEVLQIPTLQSVTLHILPRCPIRSPTISIDPIARALGRLPKLKCLQLILGYQHNPYGSPMISSDACHTLLAKSGMLKLRLTNCGLTPNHLQPLYSVLVDPNSRLISLHLDLSPSNPMAEPIILPQVVHALQHDNTTLQRFMWDPQQHLHQQHQLPDVSTSFSSNGSIAPVVSPVSILLRQAHMWCRYNRCGRRALRETCGTRDYSHQLLTTLARAAAAPADRLDVTFTILRTHPSLICQAAAAAKKAPSPRRKALPPSRSYSSRPLPSRRTSLAKAAASLWEGGPRRYSGGRPPRYQSCRARETRRALAPAARRLERYATF